MKKSRILLQFLLGSLLVSLCSWRYLFGNPIGIFDWAKETYFLEFLRASIREFGVIPKHFYVLPDSIAWYPTVSRSLLYFANPELITYSPFVLLLYFFSASVFIKILYLVHLLLGLLGLVLLFRNKGLGIVSLCLLALCTVSNPWLLQHIAIGYTPWINLGLIPLILAFLFTYTQWWTLILAILANSLMIYQGGFHLWVWTQMAIVAGYTLYLFSSRKGGGGLRIVVFFIGSVISVLPKFHAAHQAFGSWERTPVSSYRNWYDLIGLLTDNTTDPYQLPAAYDIYHTNFYDSSLYMGIGWIALFFVSIFLALAIPSLRKRDFTAATLGTGFLFLVLGWEGVWSRCIEIFPPLSAEIYPYRFLLVSIMCFSAFSIVTLDTFARVRGGIAKLAYTVLCIVIAIPVVGRIDFFARIATSGRNPYEGLVLHTYFTEHVTAQDARTKQQIPVQVFSDRCEIDISKHPEAQQILLPWLTSAYLNDFSVQYGTGQEHVSGVLIEPARGAKRVVLLPR